MCNLVELTLLFMELRYKFFILPQLNNSEFIPFCNIINFWFYAFMLTRKSFKTKVFIIIYPCTKDNIHIMWISKVYLPHLKFSTINEHTHMFSFLIFGESNFRITTKKLIFYPFYKLIQCIQTKIFKNIFLWRKRVKLYRFNLQTLKFNF